MNWKMNTDKGHETLVKNSVRRESQMFLQQGSRHGCFCCIFKYQRVSVADK